MKARYRMPVVCQIKVRYMLTHWGRVTHICVSKLSIIGSDNGLSPGRRQAIIWTIARILLVGPLGTNFSEILIGIQTFSFKKMHLKMSSAKWRPFRLGLNDDVIIAIHDDAIKWKHFPRYWPFVRGIHRSPVDSPHKGQWRGALMFSLIFVWINGWVNNREAGDLRRYRAHYDVTVMYLTVYHFLSQFTWLWR